MGFGDIQAFNIALLAKQVWRLLHHTHSLFYWVYKARYFPNCSFLEAELGHNPSYVWRSLMAARDIIRAASKWKVGDSKKIRVAVDNWLAHKPVFTGEEQPDMLVSELIDEDTGQWNR
ncbi:putative mitochondrial protein AtMg00310 [Castanea sativa]|uniref:putative mitochondrial protein AtMg00310 n=1 Tax=Castanea sativa TaxID=21020 RepID=UPI003F64FD7C